MRSARRHAFLPPQHPSALQSGSNSLLAGTAAMSHQASVRSSCRPKWPLLPRRAEARGGTRHTVHGSRPARDDPGRGSSIGHSGTGALPGHDTPELGSPRPPRRAASQRATMVEAGPDHATAAGRSSATSASMFMSASHVSCKRSRSLPRTHDRRFVRAGERRGWAGR